MSFLPHGKPRALPWYGSFAASLMVHGGIVSFILFSGYVALKPTLPEDDDTPDFTVSLEILDANIIEELAPIDDTNMVPEDAAITEPDQLETETPDDLASLAPDEQDMLAPEEDAMLEPEADPALEPDLDVAEPDVMEPEPLEPDLTEPEMLEPDPIEPEVAEPEVQEPDVLEPDPIEPEVAEPAVIEPEPIEPEVAEPEVTEPEVLEPDLADVLPELENEPLLVPDENTEPEVIEPEPELVAEPEVLPEPTPPAVLEPEVDSPLAIDDVSPIDSGVINPMASGGGGVQPDESEDLALLAPEPTLPEPVVIEPEVIEETAPVVLPEAEETAPVVLPEAEEIAPEPVIDEPVVAEPDPVVDEPVVNEPAEADPVVAEPEPEPEAPPAPPAPVRRPIANPTASDVAIGQLLRRIRATAEDPCTLAMPRRVSGGNALAALSLVGADETVVDALAERITDGLDFNPVQITSLVDPRQCAALDALRQSESYPANRIGLSIESTTLSSGDLLTGRIIGAGGLYVTLLLIDDNGVVQDLAPFVQLDGTTPVFEAPVARSGPTRATRQVLLAIGTAGTPLDLSDSIGQVAQDVFGPIPSETLQNMVFGVATFDVQ